MLEMELKDFDELYDLSLRIQMFAYLQYLTEFSDHEDETSQNISHNCKYYAKSYLLDEQCKTVKNLMELIEKDSFVKPQKPK